MPTNLAGNNQTEFFSTAGALADPNAPYTNTGGANAGATLTLMTTKSNVVVMESASAFSGARNPIAVTLDGPGEFVFLGANAYSGGTAIDGGELSIGASEALGGGALAFAGDDDILESTVSATLTNAVTIGALNSATIEAAAGETLTLAPAGDFTSLGGDDAMLRFGSALDTGTVVLAPVDPVSIQGARTLSIDGGALVLGDVAAVGLLNSLDSPVNVGLGAASATLDVDGEAATLFNLTGSAAGIVTDNGAATTITTYNTVNSVYAGVIGDGVGKVSLVVDGSGATTLTLTGANDYTGGTTVDFGQTLAIGARGTTGSIMGSVVDNGALAFERGDNLTFAGTISGTGTVTENGAGILTLTGANMFSGGVTIAAGEISIGQIDALGTGALTFSGNDTALEAQGDGVFDDALSVAAGVSATLGAVAGETLDLSCAGGFTENGGPGAALHFGSSVDTGTVELAMSGTISALANSGVSVDGGELLVGNSAAARYLQQLFALTVGSGAAAAKLDLNGLAVRAQNLTGASTGDITDGGAATTLTLYNTINSTYAGVIADGSGAISVAVQAFGGGSLALTGANSYSGGTTINSGAITLGNVQALGSGGVTFAGNGAGLRSIVSGALANNPVTIQVGVSAVIGAAAGVTLTIDPTSFADNGGAGTTLHFGGAADTGTARLAPTTSASASAAGAIAVDGGALALGDALAAAVVGASRGGLAVGTGATSATLDLDGQSTVAYNLTGDAAGFVTDNGAATTLTADAISSTTFSGVISDGSGALSLATAGLATLTLAGNNAYSGGTTIENGRLALDADASAGSGAIAFASQAFGALTFGDDVDPSNTIVIPDATDLIDLTGVGFAYGERLALLSSGVVSTYALESSSGAVLATFNLAGALDESTLIVGGDGGDGAEIAVAYTAAAATASAALASSATRVLIVDTASHIAAHAAAINALIAAGRVASVFTSGATLSDGAPLALSVIGGDDAVTFANASGDVVSLYGTLGQADTVTGADGTINLSGARAQIIGGGDLVQFTGGAGNVASLANTDGAWDLVAGSNGVIYLSSAQASVVGGGDSVDYAAGSGDAASLYQTGANWDFVTCTDGVVYLTSAKASVSGGGDAIRVAGGSGNAASLYDTGTNWDTVTGSDTNIYLTDSRASVFGGDDTIYLLDGPDDRLSLYQTAGAWDLVGGEGATIYFSDAQASVVGCGDTIDLIGTSGNAASLYNTDDDWDVVAGSDATIYSTSAQASVFGGSDTLDLLAGAGDAVSLYQTSGAADTIEGSNATIYLTSAQTSVIGGGDTIDFSSATVNVAALSGTKGAFDNVNGSGGTIDLAGAESNVKGSSDSFALTGNSTLNLNGAMEFIAFSQGIGGADVIAGFVSSDVIQFSKLDFASFAAMEQHTTQGTAGAVVTLDSKDFVTLANVAASSLTASEFAYE